MLCDTVRSGEEQQSLPWLSEAWGQKGWTREVWLCWGQGLEGTKTKGTNQPLSGNAISARQQRTQLQFLSVYWPREDLAAAVFSPLEHRHLQEMYSSPLVA